MNKTYRLIWNEFTQTWVAVAECAKARGKRSSGAVLLAAAGMAALATTPALAAPNGLPPAIVTDGRTQTTLSLSGNTTTITTATTRGANAFNSFTKFGVDQGNTVNLMLPGGTANLLNLVHGQQSYINGLVNSYKDGRIGGNVFFFNPYGIVVGQAGVINTGTLTLSTPTPAFMDQLMSPSGLIDTVAVDNALAGRIPLSSTGLVSVQGKINALDSVTVAAAQADISGQILAGPQAALAFADLVNAADLPAAVDVRHDGGVIRIVAADNIQVSGTLAADGLGDNASGGQVIVKAGGDALLASGGKLSANAGSSGDGGFVEFSAAHTVELAGGSLQASATQGTAGSILIDPENLTISADLLRGTSNTSGGGVTWDAGSLTLQADEQLTIGNGVVVSTRQVAGTTRAAHINDASTGNSGDLILEAAHITLGTASMLLANATGAYTAGNVTLTAASEFSLFNSDSWSGTASISLSGATIKGKDVTLAASSIYDDSVLTYLLPVTVAVVGSSVDVTSSTLNASGNLTLGATSLTKASTSGLVPLGSTVVVSTAAVDVGGASSLTSGGNLTLNASSTVESKVTPGYPDLPGVSKPPGDAGVALNVIVSTASTHVGDSTALDAIGAAAVTATNKVTATTKADASAEGVVAVGGTVALSEVTTVTKAYIDGTAATTAASLNVAADSQNTVTTSAKAAAKGANQQTEAEKAATPSLTEKVLAKFKNQAKTTEGSVEVAAAVAVANVNSVTQAYIASTGTQATTDATSVTSKASTTSSVTADGSSTNSEVGIGAAVGLNIGVLVNQAYLADDSVIDSNGLTVSATMPTDTTKNAFTTSATSGAGTSNVGVAGSLGVNVLVNTSSATIDDATVDAGTGDVLVDAQNLSSSTVAAGAKITPASATQPAQVGIGATVGTNVAVNTTTAEIANGASISGGKHFDLKARTDHTVTTAATGGAAGDKVAVTPVAAVTVAVNTTSAHLGTGGLLDLTGNFTASATQKSLTTSTATGQTVGDKVAVGASIALTIATDTVTATIERDVTADGTLSVAAQSTAKTASTAAASVAGGQKAASDGKPPADASGAPGKTVDEQTAAQGDAAKTVGSDTAGSTSAKKPQSALDLITDLAVKAGLTSKATQASGASADATKPTATTATTADSGTKIQTADTAAEKPKAETSEGGVSVAAAVGVNVAVTTTRATIGEGRKITSGGATSVTSTTHVDGSTSADGSQVSNAQANVGVGAAVALNAAVVTNQAIVRDDAEINAVGLTISAQLQKPETTGFAALVDKFKSFIPGSTNPEANNFSATSKSGAGAGDVGVAGSLAVNTIISSSEAVIEGDKDNSGTGAKVDAGGGTVKLEATNQATSAVVAQANVKNGSTGEPGTVGVGASIGVNVSVNTTRAEAEERSTLTDVGAVDVDALAVYTQKTEVTGGAAGSKVSITPVAAVAIALNTTTARLGESISTLNLTGNLNLDANQKNSVTTKATGQAEGDVAVGASLAAAVVVDQVSASLERDVSSGGWVAIAAQSDTSLTTSAKAGAKGTAPVKKNATTGAEEPEAGTTVDEQKTAQLDFAKGTNKAATDADVKTDTPAAETPDVNSKTPDSTTKPTETDATTKDQQGKKVSVAAAIGVSVAYNEASAKVGAGRTVSTGVGKALSVTAQTDTNYATLASGEAVSDNVGVAAAVALTATMNKTHATIGAGTNVTQAGDVSVSATSRQNINNGFLRTMSAEALSGASGGDVAVAGALAVVANDNDTLASIDEGATLGTSGAAVGDVTVTAEDSSHIAAAARAGALSKGGESKAGVGASFAVLLANNVNTAAVGRDADKNGSFAPTAIYADSLTVQASKPGVKNVLDILDGGLTLSDLRAFKDINTKSYIDNLDPAVYLGLDYYTEAVAGAAAKGDAAVAGAFAVNIFGNTTQAYLGDGVSATLSGHQASGLLGAEVSSLSHTLAASFAGGVAGAKQAGVGISNTDIINLDQTLASIGDGAHVTSTEAGAGVKVLADSQQIIVDIGISGGLGTQSTGVGGVLGVAVSLIKTEASIGDGAVVKAKGDVDVLANNDSLIVIAAGGVGGGKDAGVGASIAANVVANQTLATVGANAELASTGQTTIAADADETVVTAVIAGAGGGSAGVAGAVSVNLLLTETAASVGQATKINTDAAYDHANQSVAITARDDTVIVSATGGAAGGGKAGVGAALDSSVLIKTVKAYVADDTVADGQQADIQAKKDIKVDAVSTENIVSVSAGFAGGGNAGVGGAVGVMVLKNDVQAYVGQQARVDTDSNVLINAEDDVLAILTAGAGAGGGTAGVGGSLAVATLIGSTKAYVGDSAQVNARGLGDAASVYSGETVFSDTATAPSDFLAKQKESAKGLSVTAYNREKLITTVVGGAGGGTAGVAATVSANVIASTTQASIGRSAKINESNAGAGADQQVRVKAVDETLLIDTAGAGAGGGTAGVGAAANVGVIAKTTTAKIGYSATVNAKKAIELDAASADLSVTTTAGFAGGGSAGVGGAVAGVGIANTTQAFIEDASSAATAAKVDVSSGDLSLNADEFSSAWLITGAGAGGGAAGVGVSLAAGVNASTTLAKIGDYAETNATGTTSVKADSTENVNTVTVAGAGGGAAGVAGTISVNVVASTTEAGIGKNAKVNQTLSGQNVVVEATDMIIANSVGGVGAGGGAAGVGATINVLVTQNTTSAYIDNGAKVDASKNITVNAKSDKYVNSATVAGGGAGAAGVTGAVSIIAVGSLFDDDAKSGLGGSNTSDYADGQLNKSAVGDQLGSSDLAGGAATDLNSRSSKLAVGQYMADSADIPLKNTQAFIGYGADVKAGENVHVTAKDSTLAIIGSVAGAGGGAAGVSGSLGVVLLHDSASAFIADGAMVEAGLKLNVSAETGEDVYNVGVTGSGAGAAAVDGALVVNVVSSDTSAYIGNADINKETAFAASKTAQSVAVTADSHSNLVSVAGSGGGAGAASVGGVVNVNVLSKKTEAFIGAGADVVADTDVDVKATSAQNVVGAGVAIRGAGAAAVSAVASTNVIDNTTRAYLGAGSSVDSNGNVSLAATDDTLIVAVSAVGNGAGAAGVGANVSANVVSSHTLAYVGEGATVNARGNAAATNVYDGTVSDTPSAMPALPDGEDGKLDINRDGVKDDDVSNGASFNVSGTSVSAPGGGLGMKGTTSVKGLSVTAVGNEKVISTTIGIAGAGAAAVTGSATVNVISAVTQASIADQAQINTTGAVTGNANVRVKAADNTFMVQTGGTVAGAGAAAVSGALETGIVSKQTHAWIGDADVKASQVDVAADASEDITTVTANVSVGGAAGVGGAVGVNVVTNETLAYIQAGADVDATGHLTISARQKTALDIVTVSGAGGWVGVSGALSVGVIDNTTQAYVENGSATKAATLNAGGTLAVMADAEEEMTTATVSAAAGGLAGVAGAVGVKVATSTTAAFIGDYSQVNQTRTGASQDVLVQADDTLTLKGGGGSGALSFGGGVGATADVNIVRNTTTAYMGASAQVNAGRDVSVIANATKDVQSAAVAAAGGSTVGVGGAVSVVSIGAALDADTQKELGNTTSFTDGQIKQDKVSQNLGDSTHVSGLKTDVSGGVGALGVAGSLNESSAASLDKTRAYIGSGSQVIAGRDVKVAANDKLQFNVNAAGAGGGAVGIGAAVGVVVANSTTEAFVGASAKIDALGDVAVTASAENIDPEQIILRAATGAGGVIGASAAVAVIDDHSTTAAYLDDNAEIERAADVLVSAATNHQVKAEALGATAGGIAVGASVATATFNGETSAYADTGVKIGQTSGKTVTNVSIVATDTSTAITRAVAGSAGIYSGAGAAAQSLMASTVGASFKASAGVKVLGTVGVSATSAAGASAEAVGVSVGYGAVGVSSAVATVDNDVYADIGTGGTIAAHQINVHARTMTPTASGLTAKAVSYGASGGLVGINGTVSTALYSGSTHSSIGANSLITGSADVKAETDTKQQANASGVAVGGWLAVGANVAVAKSDADTQASLGESVDVTGNALAIHALGSAENNATAISGSGGLVAGAAASATTLSNNTTLAHLGAGSTVAVDSFALKAQHTARFNSSADSFQAAAVGAAGAIAINTSTSAVTAKMDNNATVDAADIAIQAENITRKAALSGNNAQAGAGGLFNGAAAYSKTTVNNTTNALIGSHANLQADRAGTAQGSVLIKASNDVALNDTARLDTGGAVAVALSESLIYSDTNQATVDVGAGATVQSDGDITLATRANLSANANARSKTYGVAGAAAGQSTASLGADNAVKVGTGATVQSDGGDVNLLAGSDGTTANVLNASADTRLWNHTALPIVTDPDADARVVQHNTIDVATGAQVRAHGDVNLSATEGTHNAKGFGEGTDSYREVLSAIGQFFGADTSSLKITGGSSYDNAGSWSNLSSGVNVNGTVEAGIHHLQYLTIKADGTVEKQSEGVSFTTEEDVLLTDRLGAEVAALRAKAEATRDAEQDYRGDTSAADAALALDNDADILEAQLAGLTGVTVDFIHVAPVLAQSGNVNITGQYLTGTNGTLNAPGDVRIDIVNHSANFLTTSALSIPDDQGGQVTFNGLGISSLADINARNQGGKAASSISVLNADTTAKPEISVLNKYDGGLAGTPSQLWMLGNVTNLRGVVTAESEGTLRVSANVDAETINMSTGGDLIQTYTPGFTHSGGNPISRMGTVPTTNETSTNALSTNTGITDGGASTSGDKTAVPPDCTQVACGSKIAGNNVYISGEKLNINGLIQAGLPDRALTIDASLLAAANPTNSALTNAAAISALRAKWLGGDHSQQFLALNDPPAGSTGIRVSYDAANDRLELANVRMGGGHMELFGNIFSTGNGQLNVMDGYGRINVSNSTSYDLAVGRLDTSGGVEGTIKITDTAKRVTVNGKSVPMVTQISRLGDYIQTYDNQTSDGSVSHLVSTSTEGSRTSSYDPLANRRFNWLNGRYTDNTVTDIYYDKGITIFVPCGWCVADADPAPTHASVTSTVQRLSGDWLSTGESSALSDYVFDYTRYTTPVTRIEDATVYSEYDTYRTTACLGDLCTTTTWYTKWTNTRTTIDTWTVYDYYKHSLNASKSIGISFLGYDTASLNVNSVNSQLLLGGLVRAVNGTATLNGDNGIQSLGGDARIVASDLRLTSANGAIGSAAAPINIDLTDTITTPALSDGTVTANGINGVALKEIAGDLRVKSVNASNGDITLIADRNLVVPTNVVVTGNSINLVALSGNVGDATTPIRVETQGSTSTFSASAAGEINVVEETGDLRVKQVKSAASDVRLSAPGSLLDANTVESVDEKSRSDLLALWDAMELTGGGADTALERNLAAQQNGLKAAYEAYFRMRRLHLNDNGSYTADAYNANYVYELTDNQAAALKSANNWNDSQMAEYEAGQTQVYHDAYARFGGGNYVAGFAPGLTLEESAAVSAGYKWSDAQLTNAIGAGLLKETSDTNIRIEDPNVIGHNIQLTAGAYIGSDTGVVNIATGTAFSSLSDAQKLALLTAESNDLTVTANGISIAQHDDFNVTASGELNATALGVIHLGSEADLKIGQVTSAQEVRVKTSQALSAKSGVTNVTSANVVLEAGRGDLGSAALPFLVDTNRLTARAGGNLFVQEASGHMVVDSVFAKGNATLTAPGSILEWRTDRLVDVKADIVNLTAGETIGQSGTDQSLDVGVDPQGQINATATNGIYINSVGGSGALGNVQTSGQFNFSVDQANVDITGVISADLGVNLTSSDDINFTGGRVRSSLGDVILRAGTDGFGSIVGSATAGPDVIAGGDLTIVAANDIGGTHPLQIEAAYQATLRGSAINAELSPVVDGNPLSVTVTGPIGDTTLNANLHFIDAGDVSMPTFVVHNGTVITDGPTLSVGQGYLGDAVSFFTPDFSARIDHIVRSKTPGLDVRAFTLNNDFSLQITPDSLHLDDLLINQDLRRNITGSVPGSAEVVSAQSLRSLQGPLPNLQGMLPPVTTPPSVGPLVNVEISRLDDTQPEL